MTLGGRSVRRARYASASVVLFLSCSQDRTQSPVPPTFVADVGPILERRCVPCHGRSAPAAGWSATTFLASVACVEPSGAPAALGTAAPILSALDRTPHQGLLDAGERRTLTAWVASGTPAFRGTVHSPSFVDPRASAFHGALLRSKRWRPMLEASDREACGRCHDGSPAPVPGVTSFAPGATACTTCHAQAGGALACGTCHGSGARPYPPRDPCFFPGDAHGGGAHAAHVEASQARAAGFPCSTCHPVPPPGQPIMGGLHGDGTVEVVFDATQIGPEASYDGVTRTCAVTCHDAGGSHPRPAWTDTTPSTSARCNECHRSPPDGHHPGPCNNCHSEANATGDALSGGPLHLDGRVELGDGSGRCGACHGVGDDPWPRTAAHAAHQSPAISLPVACESCHRVPLAIADPVHLDGVVHVQFSALAIARGAAPVWNGAGCDSIACHGAKLVDPPAVVPVWTDTSGAASKCGSCHGIPPSQHTPSKACGQANCHAGEVAVDALGVPSITASGKALHMNGVIDHQ